MTVIRKILTVNAVCASLLVSGAAHAQYIERQVITSTGKNVTYEAGSKFELGLDLDWTAGDIAVRTITYPDVAMLTQGFLQPPLQNLLVLKDNDMVLYPNPIVTTPKLTIVYMMDTLSTKLIDIRIISIGGTTVYTEKGIVPTRGTGTRFDREVDVSNFYPGVYVVTLYLNTGIKVSRKFIKFASQ
ncbi:T9SS type A sorting domain-containing protein [Chitinophaga sp. CF418]|uniref:T9SS type A sorting domain-containing protein n=1 Tax=Chitinophaga sp. CF418 TaxID=1855287 RepID=UPI0009151FAA|nr:T9SS type A sorting domain-containing protein [Chitinophaga sp. CF418]SHN17593.1 hypothetical protein SAMN05216311_106154 [Chitinophaga sp. CF418]